MSNEFTNPFVLPGAGQDGEAARNPLFAGLEMMRQAWQGMAGSGFEAQGVPLMSIEDLDRRLTELRSIQNWLQLNASILGNTIQGLEIQRATLSTLRAFADHGLADSLARAPGAAGRPSGEAGSAAGASSDEDPDASGPGDTAHEAAPDTAAAAQAYAQAAGEWWTLLQQQFQNLADVTAATLQGAGDAPEQAPDARPAGGKAARKPAARSAAKKATRTAKSAAKSKSTGTSGSATRTGASRARTRG